MERIKQAIEKARQQKTGETKRQPVSAERPVSPSADSVVEVNYSETKVTQLNPAHLERNRIVAFNKSDPVSLSFDILRTQLLRTMDKNGWRTMAITSPIPGCGKSMVAINLAISIAQHTSKTAMLVDFDLRRPSVAAYLGIAPEKSLNDVLNETATLSEGLVNPGVPKLVVLPTMKPFPKPSETLSSKKVASLIRDIRDRYQDRVILFDLPPLLSADDVITVLPQVDCVLMIVGNGMVTKSELEDSLRHLHGAHLLGVVLNKAETTPNLYYY